ncbi:MAG: GTPase, partial [Planctomycetaceae bacterium]
QVAIVGEPNVGKSTLLNSLLGFDRSIVFDEPGTTRDIVSARTVFEGWSVMLSDTAGIRESDDAIEATGVSAARTRAEAADLRLHVLDLSSDTKSELEFAGRTLLIGNKSDVATEFPENVEFQVAATTGAGLNELIHGVVGKLVPRGPDAHQCVPVSDVLVDWLRGVILACETRDLETVRSAIGSLPV